ncbi:la-related protein 1-like isoform X1 [Ostrinia furnacalis]|uniref:la-related protein 1-like isoform X1 n=1 Tax=Ostrinia furnacalis TaxID=93504 RepID=UPI00103C93AE|nr:la-related protein 1-like isoform X1 [Ostrinia furnacalis]
MATRVSAEAAGPSYASVLNFRGGDSNKENIEAAPGEVPELPPRAGDDEEEEGFVPVIAHRGRPGKSRRERERRAPPRPHKAPSQHAEPQAASEQQQAATDAQPKKFVEAPIPKVNPWQVRGGSTGAPPPAAPALEEKRSPLQPQQQGRAQPPPEPVAAPAPKPAVVKPKTSKIVQKASDFTDIGDWPTLSAAVAGARCHSTPPPQEADSSHHNGNADQDRKPLEEHHHQPPPRTEKVEPAVNHQPHAEKPYDKHNDKSKPPGPGKGSSKSGKHKWVPLDIDVKAARPGKHAPPHTARPEHEPHTRTDHSPERNQFTGHSQRSTHHHHNDTVSLNGEDTRGRGSTRGRGGVARGRGARRGRPASAAPVPPHPHRPAYHHEYHHADLQQVS